MSVRVSRGNPHIEALRERWAAGEATPEEIREVRAFLEEHERSLGSLSWRDRAIGFAHVIAFIASCVLVYSLLKWSSSSWAWS